MFVYEKKLQYPVNIKTTNPKLAKIIITQYGGPDGELGASLRYLSQRFTMPMPELKGTLTDIGTEIKAAGFEDYFVDHTTGIYPQSAGGTPFTAAAMQSKGDPITDLHENMAAEENAVNPPRTRHPHTYFRKRLFFIPFMCYTDTIL